MMILAIYNYIHTLFELAGPKVVVKNKSRGPFAVSHTSYNVMTSWCTHAPLIFGCIILHTTSVTATGTLSVAEVRSTYFKECTSSLFCHMVQKWCWYGIGSMQMWCTDTRARDLEQCMYVVVYTEYHHHVFSGCGFWLWLRFKMLGFWFIS